MMYFRNTSEKLLPEGKLKQKFQFQPSIKQDVHNGGGIIPEEDSCVIADVSSDTKDDDVTVRN